MLPSNCGPSTANVSDLEVTWEPEFPSSSSGICIPTRFWSLTCWRTTGITFTLIWSWGYRWACSGSIGSWFSPVVILLEFSSKFLSAGSMYRSWRFTCAEFSMKIDLEVFPELYFRNSIHLAMNWGRTRQTWDSLPLQNQFQKFTNVFFWFGLGSIKYVALMCSFVVWEVATR